MGKEKRANSKKGKLVGAIAGTALMAVPFMAVPAAANVETELPEVPVVEVDNIQTIVIPQNGSKFIDLNELAALYGSNYLYIIQDENGMDIAKGQEVPNEYRHIYEIKGSASNIGRATFTVSGYKYIPESGTETVTEGGVHGTYISDTFDVVVVPNTGEAQDYKFDISNVISMMQGFPEKYRTPEQVKGLLGNVSPKTVVVDSPIDFGNSNHAPVQREDATRYDGMVGETFEAWGIEESLTHYFADSDDDNLDVIFIDRDNPNIRIDKRYDESNENGEYELTPLVAGDFDLDVLVIDQNGGITKGVIPFHIVNNTPPALNPESVLAKHFSLGNVQDPILYLSPGAEIDLNEIFYDAEYSSLNYEAVVEVYSSTATWQETIELPSYSPILSWESLAEHEPSFGGSINKILELRAYEEGNETNESVLGVNIVHTAEDGQNQYQDLFPDMQKLYQSNAAGVSSYLFDFKSNQGFDGYYTEITDSDIYNIEGSSVTASVYENVYLKFDVNTNASGVDSKIKIYGHNRETESILYQDDFKFKVITPLETLDPDYDHPAISLRSLYPNYYDGELWTGPDHVRDYVSVSPETLNDEASWTYETSSHMSVRLQDAIPTGTQVVFKIDLDEGKRVFYVPYIKE